MILLVKFACLSAEDSSSKTISVSSYLKEKFEGKGVGVFDVELSNDGLNAANESLHSRKKRDIDNTANITAKVSLEILIFSFPNYAEELQRFAYCLYI